MKKILLSFMLILFTFSINGCLKRDIIANPQQPANQGIIIPIPSREAPINQNVIISEPAIEAPINQNVVISEPTIEAPINQNVVISTPIIEEVIPRQEVITPPPSTAGDSHQLRTVQGTTIAIQERSNGFVFPQYRDKVVLLQIFGQHCPYCLKEMPMIHRAQQQYAGSLQIIGVQAQEPMSQATASMIIQQYQMNYPIIDKEEAVDLLYFLQQTYGWTGILPYTLLIKNGVTEYSFFGEVSSQELNEAIQSLI